ncbi:hypothetical protein B0A55_05615 [Friedmanniomyces simplex]|uniref:Uncharacterized protein n=1 Tax=Friedmanniomyces simplex TaxID=329884 RepID=A0A4U0X299_9PEZI|nr:hypothetical protein B0A55_05615 [Friedmanniomyces simplex]
MADHFPTDEVKHTTSDSDSAEPEAIQATAESEPESPFLRIPGELRNEIYRYALLEDDTIKINKHAKPAQPGMLQTNRQCRKEAGDIYYHENTFLFGISHFEASIYVHYFLILMNWANLLIWLEAYWNHECGGIVGNTGSSSSGSEGGGGGHGKANADAKAATHLFAMVKKIMQRKALGWEDAREFLEEAHAALAEIKPRWAWRSGAADMTASLQ